MLFFPPIGVWLQHIMHLTTPHFLNPKSLLKGVDCISVGLFLGPLFCSIDVCVCLSPVPHSLAHCDSVVSLNTRQSDSSLFILLCQDVFLALLGLVPFHINVTISLFMSARTLLGVL